MRNRLWLVAAITPVALTGQSVVKPLQFNVAYATSADSIAEQWRAILSNARFLERAARGLNRHLALKQSITLEVASCGDANARFNPRTRHATVCYELIEEIFGQLLKLDDESASRVPDHTPHTDSTLLSNLIGTARFFLFHEVAHGLISTFKVPVTGKVEDAADQLAVILLERVSEGSGEAGADIEGASLLFSIWAGTERFNRRTLTDVHALAAQRTANLMCWSYATDELEVMRLSAADFLSSARVAQCPAEWAQIRASWGQLLREASP